MHAYGCGQCMPCRIKRMRMWAHRIMLEAAQHGDNAFLTLTYADECLPGDGSLDPRALQNWLKRFRKAVEPARIRFYAVGEYGDEEFRPHYHVVVFGYPHCLRGNTKFSRDGRRAECCQVCSLVQSTWEFGRVSVDPLEHGNARYVVGYVAKKMTRRDDPRLEGKHPEFCRMSLRPGIGADAMYEVASSLLQYDLHKSQGDVPSALRHGSSPKPLGRYLTKKLRTMVGLDEKCPPETLQQKAQEMLPVLKAAQRDPENPSFKGQLVALSKTRVASIEARHKIFKQRKKL